MTQGSTRAAVSEAGSPKVGEVRLDPGTTKSREGRVFYLTSELYQLLKRQRALADEIQREKKMIVRYVFFPRSIMKSGELGHFAATEWR